MKGKTAWWLWPLIGVGIFVVIVTCTGVVLTARDSKVHREFTDPVAENSSGRYTPYSNPGSKMQVITKQLGQVATAEDSTKAATIVVRQLESLRDYQGQPCVRLTVEISVSKGWFPYNQYEFLLQTPDGIKHPPSCIPSSEDTALHSGTVPAGQHVSGYLNYSIPTEEGAHGQVEYHVLGGPPLVYWRLGAD
jgi:hypothetical protein